MAGQVLLNSSSPAFPIKVAGDSGKRVVLMCGGFSSPLKTDGTEYTQIVETDKDGNTTRTFKIGIAEFEDMAFPVGSSISITVVGTGTAYIVWSID